MTTSDYERGFAEGYRKGFQDGQQPEITLDMWMRRFRFPSIFTHAQSVATSNTYEIKGMRLW